MTDAPSRRPKRHGRDLLPLTVDRLGDLPQPCGGCTFWESTPAQVSAPGGGGSAEPGPATDPKRGWLTTVLLEWGSPGRVAYVDGEAVGYLTCAPAGFVPRALAFATAPAADDALLVATARLDDAHRGQGLGRALVQAAARDAVRRGYRALEAFASTTGQTPCMLPVEFLTEVGFQTVREHPSHPRLRLDLRTALAWREDVELAVERLFAPVRGLGRRPVSSAPRTGS